MQAYADPPILSTSVCRLRASRTFSLSLYLNSQALPPASGGRRSTQLFGRAVFVHGTSPSFSKPTRLASFLFHLRDVSPLTPQPQSAARMYSESSNIRPNLPTATTTGISAIRFQYMARKRVEVADEAKRCQRTNEWTRAARTRCRSVRKSKTNIISHQGR